MIFFQCVLRLEQKWRYLTDYAHRQLVRGTCMLKMEISTPVLLSGEPLLFIYVSIDSRGGRKCRQNGRPGCPARALMKVIMVAWPVIQSRTLRKYLSGRAAFEFISKGSFRFLISFTVNSEYTYIKPYCENF